MLPSSGEWIPEDFDTGAAADAAQRTRTAGFGSDSESSGRRGTLFGMTGSGLLGLGILLVMIGVFFLIAGFSYVMSSPAMPSSTGSFQQDQAAADAWFQESQAHNATGFGICVVGMIFLGIGVVLARFGMVRPVASYVATEASPAIETAAEAIGRGLREAHGDVPPAASSQSTVVKVKCQNCGYLDSEDATYCSKCGKPL